MKPDYNNFEALCKTHNLVPVCHEFLADLETPVSILRRLQNEENVFLFESVEGGEHFGRYSFIGLGNGGTFSVSDGRATFTRGGETEALSGGLAALREILKNVNAARVDNLPPFFGGAVGYMGYETVNEFEKLPPPKAPLDGPSSCFFFADDMLVFDNVRHTLLAVICVRPGEFETPGAAYAHAETRIARLLGLLKGPQPPDAGRVEPPRFENRTSRGDYCRKVNRAKQYIRDGDIIQVVLSQRFTLNATIEASTLYRALRLINPSPYTFFLKMGDRHWIGSSPETMVRLTQGKAELRPIAGTRRRGATPDEDERLAGELLGDEKECAEHLMLVDLGRNDLSRVCRAGSVQVRDFKHIERYSHVMHLVSQVEGGLLDGKDAFDLLRAVFPAGTLSGAPKVRAMEIIHELEDAPRGTYGGAIGYFSYTHNMDMAITIRTIQMRDGEISIQAGAGIVADSNPESEADECLAKARALFKGIRLAAQNLDINTL